MNPSNKTLERSLMRLRAAVADRLNVLDPPAPVRPPIARPNSATPVFEVGMLVRLKRWFLGGK